MLRPPYRVLFVCTGNSARSILAEAALRHWGGERFIAYSAGSQPKGELHPLTLELFEEMELPIAGLRSKSWDEFAGPEAPALDFVFTVCDKAAGEIWPVWPGQPLTAHWGVADPAASPNVIGQPSVTSNAVNAGSAPKASASGSASNPTRPV